MHSHQNKSFVGSNSKVMHFKANKHIFSQVFLIAVIRSFTIKNVHIKTWVRTRKSLLTHRFYTPKKDTPRETHIHRECVLLVRTIKNDLRNIRFATNSKMLVFRRSGTLCVLRRTLSMLLLASQLVNQLYILCFCFVLRTQIRLT